MKKDTKKENPEETTPVEVKNEEVKVEEVKTEEVKVEEPKAEEPKVVEVKNEEVKVEEPKTEEPKAEEVKTEEVKVEEPKTEEPKVVEVKAEEIKVEEPKVEETTSQPVSPNSNFQQNQASQTPPVQNAGPEGKSKTAAGVLGILLGCFGVHNFYLGYTGKAVAQLLITLLSFFTLGWVSSIWGLVEGILILTGSINVDGKGNKLV